MNLRRGRTEVENSKKRKIKYGQQEDDKLAQRKKMKCREEEGEEEGDDQSRER